MWALIMGEKYFKSGFITTFPKKKKYIIRQSSCNDSFITEGDVKRKDWHLLVITRALLFQNNVLKGEIVLTNAYLKNKMPYRVLDYWS